MSRIVDFLCADGKDASGRTLQDVLAMNDVALERHHDFIQWLFPLDEASRAVPGSPVLGADDIAQVKSSAAARARMEAAAERMLAFYGVTSAWRQTFDHNHLRITRIIKSLRLLVDDDAADGFRREIVALAAGAPIDASARKFWERA